MNRSSAPGVLIVVENLPAPFDRRVWAEATSLRKAGYTVSVICPMLKGYDEPYECIDGVHIYRHPLTEAGASRFGYLGEYAMALFWQLRLALKVRKERGFDVIHACNPPDLIFLVAGFFRLFFGTRFIFDHHDLCPELFDVKYGRKGVFKRIARKALVALERATFALADVSIATNESYRRIAVERGRMKPKDVYVVRSGPRVDRLKIGPGDAAIREGRAFLVSYVGVIGEQEGLDLLVDAVDHLVNRIGRRDALFAIVGDGPAREGVMALARARGVDEHMRFLGRVDDERFLKILNTSDVCVNADRYCEMNDKSTMNKILEYMTLSKPIVQFDLHEGRQSAGEASLYARPDDTIDFAEKIDSLLSDPDRRRAMGEIGRQRIVSGLSWAHSEPVLLRAYASALSHRAPRRRDVEQMKEAAE